MLNFLNKLLRWSGYELVRSKRIQAFESTFGPYVNFIEEFADASKKLDEEIGDWDMNAFLEKTRLEKNSQPVKELGTPEEEAVIESGIVPSLSNFNFAVPEQILPGLMASGWYNEHFYAQKLKEINESQPSESGQPDSVCDKKDEPVEHTGFSPHGF